MVKSGLCLLLSLLCCTCSLLALSKDMWLAAAICHLLGGLFGYRTAELNALRGKSRLFDASLAWGAPAIGGILCASNALLSKQGRREGIAESYTHHIDPEEYRELFSNSHKKFKPEPEKLQPIADILNSEVSLTVKRTAIEALAQMESPEAVSILREALKMESVEVRFFAASVLTRLENYLSERLKVLEKQKTTWNPQTLMDIAQVYFDYAFFGMAEGERKEKYLEKSLKNSREAFRQSMSSEALALTGRSFLAMHKFPEAKEIFDHYVALNRNSSSGLIWRAEALAGMRNFTGAIRDCRRARELGGIPKKIRPCVDYWAGAI